MDDKVKTYYEDKTDENGEDCRFITYKKNGDIIARYKYVRSTNSTYKYIDDKWIEIILDEKLSKYN